MGGEHYLEVDALRKPGASGVQLTGELRGEGDVDQRGGVRGIGVGGEGGTKTGNVVSIKLAVIITNVHLLLFLLISDHFSKTLPQLRDSCFNYLQIPKKIFIILLQDLQYL